LDAGRREDADEAVVLFLKMRDRQPFNAEFAESVRRAVRDGLLRGMSPVSLTNATTFRLRQMAKRSKY
jgi:hypothetical protein